MFLVNIVWQQNMNDLPIVRDKEKLRSQGSTSQWILNVIISTV